MPFWLKLCRGAWMSISTIATIVVVALILWPPAKAHSVATTDRATAPVEMVRVSSASEIEIQPGSEIEKKLQVYPVVSQRVTYPVLSVTGSIVARIASDKNSPEDHWQFSSQETAVMHADWIKARAEVANAERQLTKVRELFTAHVDKYKLVVKRLKGLVASGTDTPKDLAAAEADLLDAELQGQKDVFESEMALQVANKNKGLLERQLQQIGLAPDILAKPAEGMVLVVANVPESRVSLVRENQACDARLFGLPEEVFHGHVERLAPSLSQDRRALRVLFHLEDSGERVRPGMFAEIGLGTDPRQAIMIPTDALLHVGRSDYVLVSSGPNKWRVSKVKAGEPHGSEVEIHTGVNAGERVIGAGAILLKPVAMQALAQ